MLFRSPRKIEPLSLRVRCHIKPSLGPFPGDLVPDRALIRCAAEGLTRLVARTKTTIFTRDMLLDPVHCGAILGNIHYQPDSVVRVWMQMSSGLYPTSSRLHRVFPSKYPSPICSRCTMHVPETLNHFLNVCPRFRAARTEAHNRSWSTIYKLLVRAAPPGWHFFCDVPLARTGLLFVLPEARLREHDQTIASTERPIANGPDPSNLLQWRPDGIAVNHTEKKIAILEHSRPFDGEEPQPGRESPGSTAEPTSTSSDHIADRRRTESRAENGEADNRRRMHEAVERKRDKYRIVIDALRIKIGRAHF